MTTPEVSTAEIKTVADINGMTVAQLARMTAPQVKRLTRDARRVRRERLENDLTVVGIAGIAEMLNCGRDIVARWRGNYLRTGEESETALPAPDPAINSDDISKPGDPKGRRGASPQWYAGTIRKWAGPKGCKRMSLDYIPRPGGRKPPGRPPRSHAPVNAAA